MNKLHYRPEISGLRALSIAFVLIYHFFPSYLKAGFIGVDIFFVISGYLIFQIISKNHYELPLRTFLKGRFLRLFPSFLLILIFTLAIGWWVLLAGEYVDLSTSVLVSLLAQSNYFEFSKSGYFDNAINIRPLLHLWSLAVEFQFYIFIALLCTLCRNRNYMLLLLLGCTTVSILLDITFINRIPSAVFFFTPFRLWEFLAGAIVALLHKDKEYTPVLNYLGVALLFLALFFISSESAHPGLITILPVLAAALLLVRTRSNIVTTLLSLYPLTLVGEMSYAMYLWHWPLLEYSKLIWGGLPPLFRIKLLILSLVLAFATTFYFEKWLRKAQKLKLLITLLIATIVGSSLILINHGFTLRTVDLNNAELNQNNPLIMTYRRSCEKYIGRPHKEDRCNDDQYIEEKTKLAVIGDSQSNAFTTVLNAFKSSEKPNYLQLGMGMCPALIGYGSNECRHFAAETFEYITQRHTFKTLIIAAQWPLYSDGIKVNGQTFTSDFFWQSFENTIAAYSKHIDQIYILYSVPLGAEPRRCFKRLSSELKGCDLPKAVVTQNEQHYRKKIAPIIQKYGLKVIDPIPAMCQEDICPVLIDSKILYLDSSHLSEAGGKFLFDHLDNPYE
jgi:peptidoglycan/LPS O-acetylase OafA/YrhL